MKVLLQRVTSAAVDVGNERVGEIGHGLLAFVGIFPSDDLAEVEWFAQKTTGLRIFADDAKPMNRSVLDVGGEILAVSQFTLAADTRKGMRPGFSNAAAPEQAEALYDAYVSKLREQVTVATGRFGADMKVSLVNDGPVTIMLER